MQGHRHQTHSHTSHTHQRPDGCSKTTYLKYAWHIDMITNTLILHTHTHTCKNHMYTHAQMRKHAHTHTCTLGQGGGGCSGCSSTPLRVSTGNNYIANLKCVIFTSLKMPRFGVYRSTQQPVQYANACFVPHPLSSRSKFKTPA